MSVLLLSCGDALVEQGYRGEALFQFTGQITTAGRTVDFEAPLRASVFWSPEVREAELDDALVEQAALSVAVRFPGIFEINVFEHPPALAWAEPDAGFRVGFVLIYEDLNRSGRYDAGELRGGARDQALLYVERPLDAQVSPTGRALTVGFHTARLPMACPWLEAGELHDEDARLPAGCALPIGAACASDADCGSATCQTQANATVWPGGYCTAPLDTPSCAGLAPAHLGGALLRPCEDADDCRLIDGYTCAPGDTPALGCQPDAPSALVLDSSLTLAAICAEDEEHDSGQGD
jgi:hypothetical protein